MFSHIQEPIKLDNTNLIEFLRKLENVVKIGNDYYLLPPKNKQQYYPTPEEIYSRNEYKHFNIKC